jgi:hypothetical protein
MNCAAIVIEEGGTNTLDDYPDLWVGDMTIPGHIETDQCASDYGTQIDYPNPGNRVTRKAVAGIPFKKPTGGKCYPPGSKGGAGSDGDKNGAGGSSSGSGDGGAAASSTSSGMGSKPTGGSSLPNVKVELDTTDGTCNCTCELPPK